MKSATALSGAEPRHSETELSDDVTFTVVIMCGKTLSTGADGRTVTANEASEQSQNGFPHTTFPQAIPKKPFN